MRTPKKTSKLAAVLTCCAAMALPTTAKADSAAIEAENIRTLNIMLMVTSLRCRTTQHDFREQYRLFNIAHKDNLNGAGQQMRAQMEARYGLRDSKRAFDRLSVQVANAYGDGHPWLGCGELKRIAEDLGGHNDRVRLSATARKLLGRAPSPIAVVNTTRPQKLAMIAPH